MLPEGKELALRMAVVWFCLFTVSALGNSIITAFYGMRWVTMDWQDRIMIGVLIVTNWASHMMAFFSKAISRVQKGELPISEGDTQLLRREQTTTTVETVKPKE